MPRIAMFCMPSKGDPRTTILQMHTVVDQPLTSHSHGRISCRPVGMDPIEFTWTGPSGEGVHVDATGSEALDVTPGRYRVVATDAVGARADVTVDIHASLPHAIVITEYRTRPASTTGARDGSVEAIGINLAGCRYLWTNGAETDGPCLHDVPCGRYSALPIASGEEDVPVFVHQCAPARVEVDTEWPRV